METHIIRPNQSVAKCNKEGKLAKVTVPSVLFYNIEYPFENFSFEAEIKNAKTIGDILTQISERYHEAFKVAKIKKVESFHQIGDLVFSTTLTICGDRVYVGIDS